jgi:hypothetical protein
MGARRYLLEMILFYFYIVSGVAVLQSSIDSPSCLIAYKAKKKKKKIQDVRVHRTAFLRRPIPDMGLSCSTRQFNSKPPKAHSWS